MGVGVRILGSVEVSTWPETCDSRLALLDTVGEPPDEEKLVRPHSDHLWEARYSASSIEFMGRLED